MELHQVRYYVALCKTLNFTRAAEACNVTQPALTRAIQRLEEELGGPLFQRERNLTQLTELGRLMRPLLEQTLATAEAAKAHADRFRKSEVASLRIGLPPAMSAEGPARALAEVMRRIPTLEIEVSAEPPQRLAERLLQGEIDVGFLVDDGALPERLNAWRLYKEAYRLAMTAAHPLAALDAVPVKALAGEAVVARRNCAMTARLCEICAGAGAGIRVRHVVDNDEHLQDLTAAPLGVALLPERRPVAPPLVTRPLAEADLARTVVLAVVNGRRFSPALDAFVRLVRARDWTASARPA